MPASKPQKVTIKTIAQHVGVSHQTVSYVLSGQAQKRKVAESTAAKVQKIADSLGYVPNYWARNLQRSRTGVVSVLFNGLHLDWSERIMTSIEAQLDLNDYLAMIAIYGKLPMYASTRNDTAQRKIEAILGRRDEGVICQPSQYGIEGYRRLHEKKVPIVFVGSILEDMSGLENVSSVTWDCASAVKSVVRHLIETGRKRIAFVGGRHGVLSDNIRFEAYKETLEEAGLPFDENIVVWDSLDKAIPERMVGDLFINKQYRPDAIFALNDSFAALVYEYLAALGIKTPDDVALAGMGDLRITRTCGITTVREPLEEIGAEAAKVMLSLLEKPTNEGVHHKISCDKLMIRRTT